MLLGLEFPPISHILVWPSFGPAGFNKVAFICVLALLLTALLFLLGSRGEPTAAPTGARNVAEASIDFIQDEIVMQTMGKDGLGWTPFLLYRRRHLSFAQVRRCWSMRARQQAQL